MKDTATEFTALLERDVGSLGETACHVLAEHVPAQGDVSGRVIEARAYASATPGCQP